MLFVTFILKNLIRRPVRSALTVLGLAVAIGSLIALLGISHNLTTGVYDSLNARGVDLVVTGAGKTDSLSSDLDESLTVEVLKIPNVIGVSSALVELTELTRDSGASMPVLIHGWGTDNFVYDDIKIVSGRRLLAGDKGKAMLGATLAQSLNKAVGSQVVILEESFEVVGVFESFVVFENGTAAMPLGEVQRLTGRAGKVTGFSLRIQKDPKNPDATVDAVRKEVLELKDSKGKPAKLAAQPTLDYVNGVSHLKIVRAMAWMVSAIGLLIGVISMLNTMVMSVLERTQEIGILRAVGWPRRRVVVMILTEAILLSLAATALGASGAALATYLLSLTPQVNGFIAGGIAVGVIVQGAGLALLIALVGGAYPAIRAARLLPTEAIRHE